jgi:hypothetical protein
LAAITLTPFAVSRQRIIRLCSPSGYWVTTT